MRSREQALDAREQHGRRTLDGGDDAASHIAMLQLANSHLMVASMEAIKLAEQMLQEKGELDHLVTHDLLTNLPNRLLLADRLKQALEQARRRRGQLAVMFIDLDRFKCVNDLLGHAIGDRLLQAVARCLVSCVRKSDTVARQGGDEFILLLPQVANTADVAAIADKILEATTQPHHIEQHAIEVGASIGISLYPRDGTDAATLIRHADTAMYHAKESGRASRAFFDPAMHARIQLRQSTEAGLRQALARQQFVLHYQPKISLSDGMLVGVEALVRWQHPQRGLLSPQHFVTIAEECGLIQPLGRWVLRHACEQAQAWNRGGWPPITMAVNTSPLEFCASGFLPYLRQTLAETGLRPSGLELELTERVLIDDGDHAQTVLAQLRALGVSISLDDFGTGYSSLSYLTHFHLNTLKIDRAFVMDIEHSERSNSLVQAIIAMGHSLGLQLVAEGVETAGQARILEQMGCHYLQGYHISRPALPDDMLAFADQRPAGVDHAGAVLRSPTRSIS